MFIPQFFRASSQRWYDVLVRKTVVVYRRKGTAKGETKERRQHGMHAECFVAINMYHQRTQQKTEGGTRQRKGGQRQTKFGEPIGTNQSRMLYAGQIGITTGHDIVQKDKVW
jgi:hypothetical protein